MGIWSRLTGRAEKAASTLDFLREVFGGRGSNSGRSVTASSALEVTTVLRCVRVISDGVATIPLKVMRKDPVTGRRTEATDHPLHAVLHDAPNDWQDTLEFRETLMHHMVLTGNAFAFINRVGGRIVELFPIEPGRVVVKRGADLSLSYKVIPHDGGVAEEFPAETIWHLRGPSWNSWTGLETVKLAREAIGLSMATEEAHARMHKNGVQTSGVYTVEGTLTDDQQKRLTAWIKKNHGGLENVGEPLVLDRAAKWVQQQMTGVDAEHIATRRHQIEEVCRALGVLPIMVGHANEQTTFASAEQMFLAHAVHTLRPWHRRFEATVRRNLLTDADRRNGLYVKFFDGELLRGAAKDRADFYAKALGAGGSPAWMGINEVRGMEDMDEVEWGRGQPIPPNATKPPAGNDPPDTVGGADNV